MGKKMEICIVLIIIYYSFTPAIAQNSNAKNNTSLAELQQQFVDLRFGMFIHFNIPTYMDQDWADPDALGKADHQPSISEFGVYDKRDQLIAWVE